MLEVPRCSGVGDQVSRMRINAAICWDDLMTGARQQYEAFR
jgi:hypothetical protein